MSGARDLSRKINQRLDFQHQQMRNLEASIATTTDQATTDALQERLDALNTLCNEGLHVLRVEIAALE